MLTDIWHTSDFIQCHCQREKEENVSTNDSHIPVHIVDSRREECGHVIAPCLKLAFIWEQ